MGLFDKVYCAKCGKEAKLLGRAKLKDGNYLCSECVKKVPLHIKATFYEQYDFDDYCALLDYLDYSDTYLRPQYHETDFYSGISLDAIHGIFHLGYGINKKTVFYETKNVLYFDLDFIPEEIKEGIIGSKVKGNVRMLLEMNIPFFIHSETVAYSEKAKAQKSLFSNKLTYENPKHMNSFLNAFLSSWVSQIETDHYEESGNENYNGYQDARNASVGELQRAMALFMFDDLENVTLDKVKMQRNRLIKTFHPDKGSDEDVSYAQKINNTYDILKSYLEKNPT